MKEKNLSTYFQKVNNSDKTSFRSHDIDNSIDNGLILDTLVLLAATVSKLKFYSSCPSANVNTLGWVWESLQLILAIVWGVRC